MPIFEYICTACQHHWELIVARSAADAPPCPQCGQPGRKELSAPAFQLKGGGWYATGYSKTGEKETGKAGAGKGEPASAAKSESAKPESKPAGTTSPDSPKSAPAPGAAKPSTPAGGS